jgi:putative phage-type endonuclease
MNAVIAPILGPPLDRSKFLGGSDAAAVMGVSPWATPVELWQEKTGRKRKDPEDPMRARMLARGHKLEPFIRDMAIDKLRDRGLQVELLATNQRYRDPEYSFLACEIDFELRLTGDIVIGGELKKWGEVDSEDVPIEYAAQFMHGLMITGAQLCLVAALRSFDDVDIFWVKRDDETIAGMRAREVKFWQEHVLADTPPDPYTFDDIKLLFPLDDGQAIEATEEIADKVAQHKQITQRIRDWIDDAEALQFEIAEYISPHARLTWKGQDLLTWKGQNDTRLSQELLQAAEIYTRDPATGEYRRISNPVAEFARTKVVRVMRHVKPKKGK